MKSITVVLFFVLCNFCYLPSAFARDPWIKLKGQHFVVNYTFKEDRDLARKILNKAEYYYDRISDRIGYTKYDGFWTRENRVDILLFPDKFIYTKATGQPAWSKGFATYHSTLFQSKSIVTYKGQQSFLDDSLPHEITHLLLFDYLGGVDNLPLWFNEGVAQLEQKSRQLENKQIMRAVLANNMYIPFRGLNSMDVRLESNHIKVAVFYAQSLSIVEFLATKYGQSRFQQIFRELKTGIAFDDAIKKVYRPSIEGLEDLEKRWVNHQKYNF